MDLTVESYLNVDELRQQVPAFFYKRLDIFQKAKDYFLIPIDYGYAYLLRSIRTKWSEYNSPNGSIVVRDGKIEFVQSYAGRPLQNVPYPARLISTPAETGVTITPAPSPVDQDAYGVNMTATPVKNNIILNYLYQRRETLDLRFLFSVVGSALQIDSYVDILLEGYYIPDRISGEWQ